MRWADAAAARAARDGDPTGVVIEPPSAAVPPLRRGALALAGDVELLVEVRRGPEVAARIESRSGPEIDALLEGCARTAATIQRVARDLSAAAGAPACVVLNARGATIYASGLTPPAGAARSPLTLLRAGRRLMADGRAAAVTVPVTGLKVSSHPCARTPAELARLRAAGLDRYTLRPTFACPVEGYREHLPAWFVRALEEGFPVLFVDPPTGSGPYSGSTGLLAPAGEPGADAYKARSYLRHAGYRIGAMCLAPRDHARHAALPEERRVQAERGERVALLLSPERDVGAPWWDNRPQLIGALGRRFSAVPTAGAPPRFVLAGGGPSAPCRPVVRTTRGRMTLHAYVRARVVELAHGAVS